MVTRDVSISIRDLATEIEKVAAQEEQGFADCTLEFPFSAFRSLKKELLKRGIRANDQDIISALGYLVSKLKLSSCRFVSDGEGSVCLMFNLNLPSA